MIWLLSLFFLSFKKGMVTPERNLDLDIAALYWHFVDIVWIISWASVRDQYAIHRLSGENTGVATPVCASGMSLASSSSIERK